MGLEILSGINKPVAVLSIAGPCRSGKSYFLSRLLGSQDAFQLGHTTDPQTFGIWMGTTALECDDYVIVLLDTEGIDAISTTATNDAQVLVLTLLLSSYFIYNSLGVPRALDLEKMRYECHPYIIYKYNVLYPYLGYEFYEPHHQNKI